MHREGSHDEIGIVTNRAPLSINLQTRTPLPSPHIRTNPRIFGELSPAPYPSTTHLCTHALRHWSIRGRPWNLISLIVSVVCPTSLSLPFFDHLEINSRKEKSFFFFFYVFFIIFEDWDVWWFSTMIYAYIIYIYRIVDGDFFLNIFWGDGIDLWNATFNFLFQGDDGGW